MLPDLLYLRILLPGRQAQPSARSDENEAQHETAETRRPAVQHQVADRDSEYQQQFI